MATIFQKFPNMAGKFDAISVYPVAIKFTANLVGGKFVFNEKKVAFYGNSGETIVLDGIAISASNGVDALTFSKALQGFFTLNIIRQGNGHPVTLAPFKFAAFSQGDIFAANFAVTATKENKENFEFVVSGELDQIPELIGLGSISVNFVLNIYRIKRTGTNETI
jgi:hypothetical protein